MATRSLVPRRCVMESTASPTDTSIENAIVRGDCLEQLAAVPD
ncbi:MAG: hypothetical protein AAGJ46_07025 [Planctomycetota bacterium]